MSSDKSKKSSGSKTKHDPDRRDFLNLTAGAFGAVGVCSAVWPLVDSLNPAADTLASATIEVDLSDLQPGQSKTVTWRGKPVFIRHRTEAEIEEARSVDVSKLPDPQPDDVRTKEGKPQWLVTVGICTHLGCVPLGQKSSDNVGDYGGWFCPCHGSHYDESGRIRKGPAPKNLAVPSYEFISDTRIKIG